ncbi:hypothetical protein MKX03_012878 [Papaver bracteatum]|nr:hypothetical protein MKX03_012878 [Papaver bracteatum]
MEYFDILPVEISLHIFSLLRTESVLHSALVSKSWKNLIHSPSFYKMHEERLLHFANEAAAVIIQERKKFNELLVPTRQLIQTCQSIEQLQQIEKLVKEGENLVEELAVLEEKANNSIRLAKKCSEICVEYNVLGKSPFNAGGRNQSTLRHSVYVRRRME